MEGTGWGTESMVAHVVALHNEVHGVLAFPVYSFPQGPGLALHLCLYGFKVCWLKVGGWLGARAEKGGSWELSELSDTTASTGHTFVKFQLHTTSVLTQGEVQGWQLLLPTEQVWKYKQQEQGKLDSEHFSWPWLGIKPCWGEGTVMAYSTMRHFVLSLELLAVALNLFVSPPYLHDRVYTTTVAGEPLT